VVIGVATASAPGSWSFTTPVLTSGQHRVYAEAVDPFGDASDLLDTMIIDV
jgi:hypothetical protein